MGILNPIPAPTTPTIPAPASGANLQPWQQPVDKQALNFTRALALQESTTTAHQAPDYNAKGATGEFGAYQWMPGNFQAQAKQFGLDPNDMSPENQDKVAYSVVKSKKDAGYMPAEIASEWNSGNKNNWQNHSGVNSKGVAYDTPAYVQGVKKHYDTLAAADTSNTDTTPAPTDPNAPVGILGNPAPGTEVQPHIQLPAGTPNIGPGMDYMGGVKDAFNGGVDQLKQSFQDWKNAGLDPVKMLEAALSGTSAAASIVTSPAAPIFSKVVPAVEGAVSTINNIPNKILGEPDQNIADNPLVQKFAASPAGETTSRVATDVGNLANTAGTVAGAEALRTSVPGPEFQGPTSQIGQEVPAQVPTTEAAPAAPAAPKVNTPEDLQAIKEKITPKPTVGQARLAMRQGRLVTGEPGGLLTKGTPDQLITTDQQLKSTLTIARRLPGASQMSEPELYTALKDEIGNVGSKLQPEMQKTPLNPDTVEKINEANTALRKRLVDEAPATEEANVQKRQDQFEAFLKKSGSDNFNDLWETAKAYDDSIPDRVKNANANSSDSLQAQRQEWLQRRSILKSAINDNETGMGATSQKAFSDMTDMYEAQNALLSKASIDTVGEPSQLNQFLKTPVGRMVKTGLEMAGAGTILKGIELIP